MSEQNEATPQTPRQQAMSVASAALGVLGMAGAVAVVCLILCVGFAAPGCSKPPVDAPDATKKAAEKRIDDQKRFIKTLPAGATDIRDEGGDNISFTLARDGVSHRYLMHYSWDWRASAYHTTMTRMD